MISTFRFIMLTMAALTTIICQAEGIKLPGLYYYLRGVKAFRTGLCPILSLRS